MQNNKLVILWTNRDRDTAFKMVFMYAHYSIIKGWWDAVEIIIWGATTKLAAEDEEIASEIKKLICEDGIKFSACITCSDSYGGDITEKLQNFGVDVKSMGPILTDYLKSGVKVLSV